LGRLVGCGLLSSVVNGCQRSGGFGREDWGHKGKSREGRKPGRHKAGKHRVTENTERKIAMVGACLGVDDSCKDLQWTVLDATV
jgi:hypothetical protein